jgi:chromosome segregation ATPase
LTKIFVVLVSLLAVLLVPLVVVYAHNENSFKARWEAADAKAAAAANRLNTEQLGSTARESALQAEIQQRDGEIAGLIGSRDAAEADIRDLQADLTSARGQQEKIRADLSKLSSALNASQELMGQLLAEVATTRSDAMKAEQRAVALDERVRELMGQLDVAVAARRAMAEELQQLKEELAVSLRRNATYVQKYGALEQEQAVAAGKPATVDLDATVLNVRRGLDQNLAEINAGSRDQVEVGWELMIARGGDFLARLRIIEVDINRSTGVIELEDPDNRGEVQAGDRVMARSG